MNGWTSGCGRRNCSKSQEMFWESGLELKVVIIFIWNISSQFIEKLYILHILKCRDNKFELWVCLGRWRHHWSYWRWHAQYNRLWLKKSKESLQLQESGEYDNHCGWRQQILHHRWMFSKWIYERPLMTGMPVPWSMRDWRQRLARLQSRQHSWAALV